TKQAQPGTHTADSLADPDLDPSTLSAEAQVSGEEATDQDLAEHDADTGNEAERASDPDADQGDATRPSS
ncbi:MAG: hypothetical protein ABIW49_02330, partial [Knoellia sp.]